VHLNAATVCVPVHFWNQQWLQLQSLINDACHKILSTSFNPKERKKSLELSQLTEQVVTSPEIHLHNFSSEVPLSLCCYMDAFHHVATTYIFMLKEAQPLNTAVFNFPADCCNMELLNVTW
jgi:hypothetical protein